MLIKGSSVIEKSKDASGGTSLTHYLQVETSTGIQSRVPFEDYRKAYEKSVGEVRLVAQDINIASLDQADLAIQTPYVGSNLNPVLSLLMEKLNVQSGEKVTKDTELVVQSELAEFLELPWESVVDQTCVFREIIHPTRTAQENVTTRMSFLLLMSHAHQPDKTNIGNEINEEVVDVLKKITENNKSSFRVDDVHFLKHGTKTNLQEVKWDKFRFVHVVLHGESDGRICFEDSAEYDKIEHMSKKDFLSLLQVDPRPYFLIVYLSFCFSGGGAETTSLAFDLVKEGVSENVIGYSGGIGSPSAKNFSSLFYNFLTCGDNPRAAFQKALEKYRAENPRPEYLPMFYMRT